MIYSHFRLTLTSVRRDVFANNRLSLPLVSPSPLANLILMSTNLTFGPANKIYACLADPEYGHSLASVKSPFMYNVRDEGRKDFFDYMKHHVRQITFYKTCISDMIFFSLTKNRLVSCDRLELDRLTL